jgi:hypothetical protein
MSRIPTLAELENQVCGLCLAKNVREIPDLDQRGQFAYRKLVRASLSSVIIHDLPISWSMISDSLREKIIDEYLDKAPPSTKLYPRISRDFGSWVLDSGSRFLAENELHPAFAQLVHWEMAKVDVDLAPDPDQSIRPLRPTMNASVEFHPSTRLLGYTYPVYQMAKGNDWPTPFAEPRLIIAHRRAERIRWAEISSDFGILLNLLAGGISLSNALHELKQQTGRDQNRGLIQSRLVDLQRKNALLGFPEHIDQAKA